MCWSFCTSVDSCPSPLPYFGDCVKRNENKIMTTSIIHVAIVIAISSIIKPTDSILIPSFRLPRWLQQPPMIINPPFITPSDLGDQCWGSSGNPGTCERGELCRGGSGSPNDGFGPLQRRKIVNVEFFPKMIISRRRLLTPSPLRQGFS